MNKQQLRALLLIALVLGPVSGFAKFPGLLKRFQVGYSFVNNKADFLAGFKSDDGKIDTTFKPFSMNTTAAFGITVGTFIPLKRMGNATSLVLGIDYLYNVMTWKSKIPYEGAGELAFDGITAQMALPIGLDFKFGGEANQTRTPRVCGTLGAGVYPSYALTALDNTTLTIDPTFAVAPYVKAEVGFRAGVCMKVRMLYAIGDLKYMDVKSKESGTTSTSQLIGKSNMAISLLIMPFAFKWQDEFWWNTY